ncbi:MAG: aldehyde dehydrogenase family protein, partial [Agrococcus casei]
MANAAQEQALLSKIPSGKLYIAGEWVDGEDGTIDVSDPATGEKIHEIANGSVADGKRALDAACAVQDEWA